MKTQRDNDERQQGVHPWKIIEAAYNPDLAGTYGSLFSLANGYAGIRGAHEDKPLADRPLPDGIRGTFLNGFYETAPIEYGESAYGFADTGETMQNVADPLPILLKVDGEVFDIDAAQSAGRLATYERSLAMSYGQLERRLVWKTASGKTVRIDSRRLVSLVRRQIGCLIYRVTVMDAAGAEVEIRSAINGYTMNKSGGDDPRLPRGSKEPVLNIIGSVTDPQRQMLSMEQRTGSSLLKMAVAVAHRSSLPVSVHSISEHQPDLQDKVGGSRIRLVYRKHAASMETLELEKYFAFADSRRYTGHDLLGEAESLAFEAREAGYMKLRQEQETFLNDFWQHGQIRLKGDLLLQQGLNFSSFHLLQNAPRDGLTSIAAKGLSGEGYEGHYFWDTELYMFPFFLYTEPALARHLLEYRYSILDQARDRAILMGHQRGALFPWRTISGRECSAYYPAGTAQFHINADIAFAIRNYFNATADWEFLWDMGAEMLIETAVFYLDLGFHDPKRGFCINEVTGPDEYSALVNNNYYTNLMAKINMESAARAIRELHDKDSGRLRLMLEKLGYEQGELLTRFEETAAAMYLPYDEKLGLPLQDDSYNQREPWDFLGTPEDKYPLLLNYHPLVIYRHRVSKQADLVLAQYLNPEQFSFEERQRAYDYYELFTTHDSSLSASVYSIMANWLGRGGKAFSYFMEAARMDLDDTHGNTEDGLHLANMAGNWLALAAGYGGLQIHDGEVHFHPQIAREWDSYEFRFVFRGNLVSVTVKPRQVIYELLEGDGLAFYHHGQRLSLNPDHPLEKVSRENVVPPTDPEGKPRVPVKAVIFDVDGVLLQSDEQHYEAWQRMANEEGIYFDRRINQRLRGVSRMASLEIILEKAGRAYTDEQKKELAERKNNYYQEAINRLDETALLPGVRKFLQALKGKGVLMASASSSRNAPTLLAQTGLDGSFDASVDGTDIHRSKPDPEVFLLAAQRLGIDPANCLVIEDAEAGIEAARRAGMKSLAVGRIAGRFLELGADSGSWGLNRLEAGDLLQL